MWFVCFLQMDPFLVQCTGRKTVLQGLCSSDAGGCVISGSLVLEIGRYPVSETEEKERLSGSGS